MLAAAVTLEAAREPSREPSTHSSHSGVKRPKQRMRWTNQDCTGLRWAIVFACLIMAVRSAVAAAVAVEAVESGVKAATLKDVSKESEETVTEVLEDEEAAMGAGVAAGAAAAAAMLEAVEAAGVNLTALTEGSVREVSSRSALPSFIRLPSIWSFIKLPAFLKPFTGKSSFLTGFGLGFLAFALKKLLLPLFIGGQILKSVLIAMFLPSILGGLGKLVGKGVTTFASASGPLSGGLSGGLGGGGDAYSGGGGGGSFGDFRDPAADGSFGDTDAAGSDPSAFAYADAPHYGNNGVSQPASPQMATSALNRYSLAQSKVSLPSPALDAYYERQRQPAFGGFQQMPASSLLLAHYDPFYSPLLSRLDSVFSALGRVSEACRQRLVCDMYAAPARFAPFSNLVSAQLSRELNELRKPSSDNPEILRFFRYMKAAKDGQDGQDCALLHAGCAEPGAGMALDEASPGAPPMLQTYHDIDKLVHARNARRLALSAAASA